MYIRTLHVYLKGQAKSIITIGPISFITDACSRTLNVRHFVKPLKMPVGGSDTKKMCS
jgi:hypothetical protein